MVETRPITRKEQALSACSGAVLTSMFTTPLDVVKVRLQQGQSLMEACGCCAPRLDTSSVMIRVARHEGVTSLWAGLQPALLMSVPGTVMYFTGYEALRDAIAAAVPAVSGYAPLLAGGTARLLTTAVVSPVELMRTRMQAEQSLRREGMVGGAIALVRREGMSALWKGLWPTVLRDVPFSCIYWSGYELLKRRAIEWQAAAEPSAAAAAGSGPAELDPVSSFACGAVSGSVAAFCTTPLDVVKTRRQVSDRLRLTKGAFASGAGTSTLLAHLARSEGIGALFSGLVPRIAKVAPACGIMIASYEFGKSFFRSRP